MSVLITLFYSKNRRATHRYLRRRFPVLDDASVHDAVQDAFLDALLRPDAFELAHRRGGEVELARLFRCVAWRKARGELRRRAASQKLPALPMAAPPGQIFAPRLAGLRELVAQAAHRFGHGRTTQLRRALEHKLWSGESDRQVADQFRVPREYLNRAKRFVQTGLFDEG